MGEISIKKAREIAREKIETEREREGQRGRYIQRRRETERGIDR